MTVEVSPEASAEASPAANDGANAGASISRKAAVASWQRFVPGLLLRRDFRRYWAGHSVSLLGDQISQLAIPLLAVLTAHAGPAQMGYLTAAGLLPYLMFSLVAGAFADRRGDKRRLMIIADAGRMAALICVPVLAATHDLTLPALYAITFAIGTLSVLFSVCDGTLFASIIEEPAYVEANTLLNGARAMSFAAGPTASGVLVQVLGAPVALLADALSYLYSAVTLGRIRVVEPSGTRGRGWGLGEGLRFIAHHRVLRTLLAATTTLNLFNYVYSAMFVLYATRMLGVRPGTLGLVLGAASIGALAGAAATKHLVRRYGLGRAYVFGQILFPAPLVLVPLVGGIVSGMTAGSRTVLIIGMLLLAELGSGFGVMVLDIAAGTVMTAATPDSLRARVAGAQRTVNYGIRPLGALLGGFLGTAVGVHAALWIGAVGGLAGALWLIGFPRTGHEETPIDLLSY